MARQKKTFKPMRSRKAGKKTQKRLLENNKILKKYFI